MTTPWRALGSASDDNGSSIKNLEQEQSPQRKAERERMLSGLVFAITGGLAILQRSLALE
jgi:hypothetical protein